MFYQHEAEERKPNKHAMCTEFPSAYAGTEGYMWEYFWERKLENNVAVANGWYESCCAGDTERRIVIPAMTHKPGHVYWQARAVSPKAYLRYTSPKGPRHEAIVVVHPNDVCGRPFGNVIVEGPMDALAAAGEGYSGYALMGMQPSKATLYHLALLLRDRQPTLVLLDRDSGAYGIPIVAFLASNSYNVRLATMPGPEKDLAECAPELRSKLLSRMFKTLFKS